MMSLATEPMLTDDEFALFRTLIYEEAGLVLRPERRAFVASRVRHRLDVRGLRSPYQYYRLLSHGPDRDGELLHFLDLLTIHDTSFFRNSHQSKLLGPRALPEILERKVQELGASLRIWSAGCSTGQEPYSLAMAVLEQNPQARGIVPKIYASDISLTALEFAQRGFYPEGKAQGVPPERLARHFHPRR